MYFLDIDVSDEGVFSRDIFVYMRLKIKKSDEIKKLQEENLLLKKELEVLKEKLETRKLVEIAKGILTRKEGLSEDEAYRKIHRKSMDLRKTMKQVAEAIILADGINN